LIPMRVARDLARCAGWNRVVQATDWLARRVSH